MINGTNDGSVVCVKVNVPDGFGLVGGKCAARRASITLFSVAAGAANAVESQEPAAGDGSLDCGGAFATCNVVVSWSGIGFEIAESTPV